MVNRRKKTNELLKGTEKEKEMLKRKRTYFIPMIGFAVIILIGTAILSLPICNYHNISLKDIFFTATSALTTTGFTKQPIIRQFNFLGQLILAILMEVGAMGFIIFISYAWSIRDKKMKMSDMVVISDNIAGDGYGAIKEHSIFIVKLMLKVQGLGIFLLALEFIPLLGFTKGLWYSIFHTISAFSNTGFDLFTGNSFLAFQSNLYIQTVLILLMFLGSIGVFVIEDVKNNGLKRFHKLKLQTKIVLLVTAILIIVPTICMKILEPNITLMNSLFMAITSRSTGFSVVALESFSFESKVILLLLMFIGGSPISTSGGVKTVTIAIVIATMIATLKGKNETIIFWRKISDATIKKAFTILMVFILVLTITSFIVSHSNHMGMLNILFEHVSAITNTGLSLVDMQDFNGIGEAILIFLMYIGRVGPLSMVLAFVREDKKNQYVAYPEENLIL